MGRYELMGCFGESPDYVTLCHGFGHPEFASTNYDKAVQRICKNLSIERTFWESIG